MKVITPTNILLFYDYPQVFVGRDAVDLSYIFMAISEEESGPRYLCTPISKNRQDGVLRSKVDLLDVFRNPEVDEFYECVPCSNNVQLELGDLKYVACPRSLLPAGGLFFSIKTEEVDEVAQKAAELNTTVSYASLSVTESKESPRIRTSKLSEFLGLYQNSINNLVRVSAREVKKKIPRNEEPFNTDVFGFSHGSFTIMLRSSSDGDLFGENHLLSTAFKKLNTAIEIASDPEKALAYLQSLDKRAATSIIRLMDFMVTNSCPVKHKWASPEMLESSEASADLGNISLLVKLCKNREDTFLDDRIFVGVFTIVNSVTNRWTVIDDKGGSMSGEVSEGSGITMDGITIQEKKYRLTCKEKTEVVSGTSKETRKLLLTKLESLNINIET